MLNKENDKLPLNVLINLCHDLISQSEYLLFENGGEGLFANDDPN